MSPSKPQSTSRKLARAMAALLPLGISLAALIWGFFFVRDLQANSKDIPQLVIVLFAIIWGVGGVVLLFTAANFFVEQLPEKWTQRLQPFIFIGPAILMLTWALVLPTIRTIIASFFNESSIKFVGLKNFAYVFTNPAMLTVFRNNLLWIVFGTTFTVCAGLLVAVLADRSRFETVAKTLIFLPMAISFVGAGVIWNFIYAVKPVTAPQIGLLNAITTNFGNQPQAWTAFFTPWNNFFLIVIVIWLQTGYSMVLFSAAIKGIPAEILESARVDGATEIQVFFRIMLPQILGTIIAVSTTIVIFTLKIFDVVWVMTGGQYDTSVIATEFYRQYFTYNNNGIGSAIAVVLFIAVIPVMIYNLRQFARREAF
ncbi:MAG: sugar ABC transporter permease [Chloroflexi bacterium]|nr:sugar ABC transporter permease [Chloroflexota bacterium]MBI1854827.1 sugar ABC transporter permease [Chloroflexota bacterium]MBI2758288.1 sugar ABC transporter permease [Chloroflexota bacterium]MBI3339740.1 sugar ABC transporter permease [Chloroflexota bacterium]